mmetsp:Transcript_48596/g.156958  ORF Transcript_48596/g.156958 Transcript_48596/m.156958 type:complete len:283 (-) Transcript_48596:271-1119(-)
MSALCDTMSASLTSLAPVARARAVLAGGGRVPRGSRLSALALVGAGSCLLARSFVGGALGVSAGTGRGARVARAVFGGPPAGRDTPIPDAPAPDATHFLTGNPMYPPWPAGMEVAMFGMGCFWCSENLYMAKEGIYSSQVGYAGGENDNPSYSDVCTGRSGHNEVVRIVYDPKVITYGDLLKVFWERHDPTTKNQQGGDRGTQYRSGIYYYTEAQRQLAEATRDKYEAELETTKAAGGRKITTEIVPAPTFFYGEAYHQQYDAKPGSRRYCGLSPTGAKLPA